MPELPEVETLRRGLAELLPGKQILSVELRLPKLVASGSIDPLSGSTLLAVRRRAKHLLVETDRAALLIHLSLAGQIVLRDAADVTLVAGGHPIPRFDAPLPHRSSHLILRLNDGATLYLTDIRHFARVWIVSLSEAESRLASLGLGPEPLDAGFTRKALATALHGRRRPLKPTLLDQSLVAGLGNIYVDEALWRASLSPTRPAGGLNEREIARLHRDIRGVLHFAVTNGVAQVLDGRAVPGTSFPAVHGREAQPCPRCGTAIVKSRVGGRGTYTCPRCQSDPSTVSNNFSAE